MLILLKCFWLSLAIVYGCSNVSKVALIIFGKSAKITGGQWWLMAMGIVGFIAFQFWVK